MLYPAAENGNGNGKAISMSIPYSNAKRDCASSRGIFAAHEKVGPEHSKPDHAS